MRIPRPAAPLLRPPPGDINRRLHTTPYYGTHPEYVARRLAAAVDSGPAPAAVVYIGSAQDLAGLAEHAKAYPELLSARWFTTDLAVGSPLLEGISNASRFAAQTCLAAVSWTGHKNTTKSLPARKTRFIRRPLRQ